MAPYRLLVFVASFLLFSIELLIGRMVLPAFGSGAQVWATCLVFFQATLLLGYLYGERAQAWIARGQNRWVHRAVVLLPVIAFPLRVVRFGGSPALGVLLALCASAGLPFFALSTTSVVAQAWLSRTDHPRRADPYFLYGWSNAGALAGLVLYPLAIEPGFDLSLQRIGWYAGYALFVALVFPCEPRPASAEPPSSAPRVRARWSERAVWLLLPAGANALLMACTNAVTIDAAVPLVWTLPLTAYLLTLVLCFQPTPLSDRTLRRVSCAGLGIAALATWALSSGRSVQGAVLVLHLCVLFVGCLLLHRAVSRARPAPEQLGVYYRDLALGGCVGGALVGLGAPVLFRHAALPALDYVLALALILPGLLVRDRDRWAAVFAGRPWRLGAVCAIGLCTLGAIAGAVAVALRARVESVRTFYGLYTVTDDHARRWFRHGNTFHGVERLDPGGRDEPLAYYDRDSPIARVLAARAIARRRVGVVGLGVGTLAAYGRADERWDFFELDPEVVRIARDDFHFLSDSAAQVSVIPGDARLTLASVPDGRYDLLVLDAFNSDFVPIHLVTREAVELYLRKLAPRGVIACHVSNRLFRLAPELVRIAQVEHLAAAFGASERSEAEAAQGHYASEWLLLSRDADRLRSLAGEAGFRLVSAPADAARPWSDDYVNLIRAVRR